ncbi:MAG: hypothetical protein EA424_23240 [Planctomycetaceae bacterium]|nr:MAG: hypothetical protein EA424_23240 [Planctomycetaceae bacterium]
MGGGVKSVLRSSCFVLRASFPPSQYSSIPVFQRLPTGVPNFGKFGYEAVPNFSKFGYEAVPNFGKFGYEAVPNFGKFGYGAGPNFGKFGYGAGQIRLRINR